MLYNLLLLPSYVSCSRVFSGSLQAEQQQLIFFLFCLFFFFCVFQKICVKKKTSEKCGFSKISDCKYKVVEFSGVVARQSCGRGRRPHECTSQQHESGSNGANTTDPTTSQGGFTEAVWTPAAVPVAGSSLSGVFRGLRR